MPKPEPIDLVFQVERDTKNKVRMQEMSPVVPGGKDPQPVPKDKAVVEKLYVSKAIMKKMGNPDILHVRIQAP